MPEMLTKGTWTKVAFGDVVRQVKDKVDPDEAGIERYIAGEHMNTDDLKIRKWGLIGDDYLGPAFHMRFKSGQVLYGSRRTYLRKVALADFEGITANTTYVVESKNPEVLLPELLPFIMQTESFHAHSIKQSKGGVNPYINFSDLVWYEFALPPLEEQRRIAEVLQAAEKTKAALFKLRASQLQLLDSLYQESFGELRENLSSPRGNRLGDLCALRRGASPRPIHDPKWFSETGPGWIRIRDLPENGRFLRETEQRLSPEGVAKSVPVHPGEVIVSIAATIGRPVILDLEACIHDGFVLFKDLSETVDRDYLYHFLHWMEPVMEAKGLLGTQKNINTSIVNDLRIPLPNIGDQRGLSALMNDLLDSIQRYEVRARQATSLGMRLFAIGGNAE